MNRKPIVAIVGRPNVGKSTLFNRLIGERRAIIEDTAGTTRDRIYGEADWAGHSFIVVDTGGLRLFDEDEFAPRIREQAKIAMQEADVIIFMTDVIDGLTAADRDVADMLRDATKPVVLAVNKADNQQRRMDALEFYEFGLGEPMPISSIHGVGTGDMLDAVVAHFPDAGFDEGDEDTSIRIAIVGRPNVGKSSLLNKILGEDRAIVSEVPGTTRDTIDTRLLYDDREFTLIDTAGIRKRGKIEPGVERYSVMRAMKAIDRSHVVLLLVDAVEGITSQDTHVAGYALDAYKSVIVLVNKWDLIEKDTYTMLEYEHQVRTALHFADYFPLLFISALTGQRTNKVLGLAEHVYGERFIRIPTSDLNKHIVQATAKHAPPSQGRRSVRIRYVTQAEVDPPTFVFFVTNPDLMHFSYERYLENQIRKQHEFLGTPLKLVFRDVQTQDRTRGA